MCPWLHPTMSVAQTVEISYCTQKLQYAIDVIFNGIFVEIRLLASSPCILNLCVVCGRTTQILSKVFHDSTSPKCEWILRIKTVLLFVQPHLSNTNTLITLCFVASNFAWMRLKIFIIRDLQSPEYYNFNRSNDNQTFGNWTPGRRFVARVYV